MGLGDLTSCLERQPDFFKDPSSQFGKIQIPGRFLDQALHVLRRFTSKPCAPCISCGWEERLASSRENRRSHPRRTSKPTPGLAALVIFTMGGDQRQLLFIATERGGGYRDQKEMSF